MKRRTLLQHSAALPLLGLLTACGGSGPSDDLPSTAQTTLLVYLVASDLLDGSGAERDLLNMLKAHNSARCVRPSRRFRAAHARPRTPRRNRRTRSGSSPTAA